MKQARKGMIDWRNRKGQIQSSFPWRLEDDQARDAVGLDLWEQAGFFGPYRCDTRQQALEQARTRLEARGFDPATAESLIAEF